MVMQETAQNKFYYKTLFQEETDLFVQEVQNSQLELN